MPGILNAVHQKVRWVAGRYEHVCPAQAFQVPPTVVTRQGTEGGGHVVLEAERCRTLSLAIPAGVMLVTALLPSQGIALAAGMYTASC